MRLRTNQTDPPTTNSMTDYELALQDERTLADPYPLYREMRARAPVYHCRRASVWVVMRHTDIAELLSGADAGCRHRFGPVMERDSAWLVNSDGPEHRHLRRSLSEGLSRAHMLAFCDHVTCAAQALAETLASRNDFDVVNDYAEPLALSTAAWLVIGSAQWSPETLANVRDWNREFTQLTGELANPLSMSEVRRAILSVRAGTSLCRAFLGAYRMLPEHTLVHHLGHLTGAGQLTFEHAAGLLTELIFATYNNVVNAIGNAVSALCREPEQRRIFLSGQIAVDAAVDELLRHGGAVQFTTRIIERHCVISGVPINQHSRVLLYLGSANRDERVFSEPDKLDLCRDSRKALSFGYGAHHCLGATLARQEIGIALRELFRQMPSLTAKPAQTSQYARPAYRGLRHFMVMPSP
jgi:cytochrome P450